MWSKAMKKGFTLIELIVVIAMLMILAGSVTSALASARKRAKIAKATVACQEMTNAILAYENYAKLENKASNGSWQPASKSSLRFILGGEKADNGDEIPVLYNADIRGTQMLDPWGKPYYFRIQNAGSRNIDDSLANKAVETCVFFPNFNRRRRVDR